MEYRRLGSSGLVVSAMTLGGATFGELIEGGGVERVVAAALDEGVTTFDTGDSYAQGRSEETLGAALRSRREQVVLCTKVGNRVGDGQEGFIATVRGTLDHAARWRQGIAPTDQGMSRKHIVSALEASLRRLQTDYVDLYQVHRWDASVPIEETLRALDDLVRAGKVRYVGCSSYAAWQLVRALWVSDVRDLAGFVSIQVPYSLLQRGPESTVFPACEAMGVGVLPFMPLAGGMLTGRYDAASGPEEGSRFAVRPTYRAQFWNDRAFAVVDQLRELAQETGRTPGQLALAWVAAQPVVSSVLVGAEEPEQVSEAATAFARPLTADERERVDALAPA